MASMVSTGPATLAGNLVVGNAEVISALALIELAYPGAPVYYAAAQTAMDLRTGAIPAAARKIPLWRGDERAGRFLQYATFDGRVRHRRQRAWLAIGSGKQSFGVHGRVHHVRHAAGRRAAPRQSYLVARDAADGQRNLEHLCAMARGIE